MSDPHKGNAAMAMSPMEKLLRPQSIALVGASEREHSAGVRILSNIVRGGFKGNVYPINPRYETVLGLRCYASLSDLPETPDVVFAAIAAENIFDIMDEAARLGVCAMMSNATGFGDAGPQGIEREKRMIAKAKSHGMVLCGPNNSGFMNIWDSTFISTFYQIPPYEPGPVAVISQSGQVSCALSQDDRGLGLGYNITVGTEAVLGVSDYAEFLIEDERITTLMLFLETLREPERFAAVARRAAELGKHVIVTKVGRSEGGRSAAAAHSGALVGDDAVYNAFFRRNGIIRASDLDEMIEIAMLCKTHAAPVRPGVLFMSISGGENGLMSDIAADVNLSLAELDDATSQALVPHLSPYLTPRNPLDVMGMGWGKQRFADIIRTLVQSRNFGTLAISVDASGSAVAGVRIATDMAEACLEQDLGDTRVVFFTGTAGGGPNRDIAAKLAQGGIPILAGMRPSLAAIARWTEYRPPAPIEPAQADSESILDDFLTADEAKRFAMLRENGVPMADSAAAASADDAVTIAERFGYPVVLKATAPNLLHKTELNLIRLRLKTPEEVRAAYAELKAALDRHAHGQAGAAIVVQAMVQGGMELIAAVRREEGFGHVVVAGVGGTLVELLKEAATEIGPVTPEQVIDMLNSTRIGELMKGHRGSEPLDLAAAANAISALSRFAATAGRDFSVVEINPLIVCERGNGAFGVDVLIER